MRDLFDYWRGQPPVHELVAAYLGVKAPSQATASPVAINPMDPSGIGDLVARFPSGFVPANR